MTPARAHGTPEHPADPDQEKAPTPTVTSFDDPSPDEDEDLTLRVDPGEHQENPALTHEPDASQEDLLVERMTAAEDEDTAPDAR